MRSLLFASVGIVIATASAPGLFTRYLERPDAAGASSAAEESVVADTGGIDRQVSSGARQVALEAERDGHFYAAAEINFRPVRLMVDTGASVVALRASDAEAAGIRPRPADFRFPVATANGATYAAEAHLDSVAVEDVEVAGVRALILPDDQLSISLLGGTFLSRLARFEISGGTLIFEN